MTESEILTPANNKKYKKALKRFAKSTGIDIPVLETKKEISLGETFSAKAAKMATGLLSKHVAEEDINNGDLLVGVFDLIKTAETYLLDSEPAKNVMDLILLILMKKYG